MSLHEPRLISLNMLTQWKLAYSSASCPLRWPLLEGTPWPLKFLRWQCRKIICSYSCVVSESTELQGLFWRIFLPLSFVDFLLSFHRFLQRRGGFATSQAKYFSYPFYKVFHHFECISNTQENLTFYEVLEISLKPMWSEISPPHLTFNLI